MPDRRFLSLPPGDRKEALLHAEAASGVSAELLDEAKGLSEVRVVRNDDGAVDQTTMSIVKQVRSEVDVRALFLGTEYRLVARAIRTRKRHRVSEELTQDDFESGKRLQGPEVGVLASGLVRVARTRLT